MSSFEIEYYTRQCKLRELESELKKCELELLKWNTVRLVNIFQTNCLFGILL